MKTSFSLISILIVSINTFAQDMYLEYRMTGPMLATNKIYTSAASGMRMEMEMTLPQVGKMITVMLMPKGKSTMYTYNMTTKTYTEAPITSKKADDMAVKFVVIGKEKVAGYNCTHIKMTMKNKIESDMWTTKDIAGYEVMEALSKTSDNIVSNKVYEQLKSKDADGIMVKTEMTIGKNKMVNQLVKAEKRANSSSLYVMPVGYKRMDLGAKR